MYLTKDCRYKDHKLRQLSHLVVLAKNLQGWKTLIKMSNKANEEELFYYKPRLDLDEISKYADGNLVAFSGHPGSDLGNVLFTDLSAYGAKSYEDANMFLRDDWEQATINLADKYKQIFGKDNFFLEIQLIDEKNTPAAKIIAKCLRKVSKITGIPCVATADSHYAEKKDATDQRILICNALNVTLKQVYNKIDNEEFGLECFFKSNNYHVPSLDEIKAVNEEEELKNSLKIADMCESYTVCQKNLLPKLGDNSLAMLKEHCRQGWRDKVASIVPVDKQKEYVDRLNLEFKVIDDAGLSDYFLIVKDFCDYADQNEILRGPGRGSAGGCLISYLTNITYVDPIRYGLIFERFYNAGRNTKDNIQFPDIDCDFPRGKRQQIIAYITDKFGADRVAHICTFGRMMGRSALKDVLRVHDAMSSEEMNKISEFIPDEAKIADDLQEMKEEEGESSIIKWSLENEADKLKDFCVLKDGNLEGPLASLFGQAIRLEGTIRSMGKHASGIVISPIPLNEFCPMVRDKSEETLMIAIDLKDIETVGLNKFDILGVGTLDRTDRCARLIDGN